MKLVFVRHGISQAMSEGRNVGKMDSPLAKEGVDELKIMREEYTYPETSYYYASPLKRARQTFEILFPDKKLTATLDNFMEHGWGELEGCFYKDFKEIGNNWLNDVAKNGEENYSDFQKRVVKGIKELYQKHANDSVTVVCHAGVVKTSLNYFYKKDSLSYRTYDIKPGYAYTFEITKQNSELVLQDLKVLNNESIYIEK